MDVGAGRRCCMGGSGRQQLIKAWWSSSYRLYRHMLINLNQQL